MFELWTGEQVIEAASEVGSCWIGGKKLLGGVKSNESAGVRWKELVGS